MDPGDEQIDPKVFIKQLAPDQLGMFEPLSGLLLLNASRAEMRDLSTRLTAGRTTGSDFALLSTINHETYHFAQAAGSGYVFQRQCGLFRVLNATEPMPAVKLSAKEQALFETIAKECGADPALQLEAERLKALLEHDETLTQLNARAAAGDNSVMGGLLPGFFAHLKEVTDAEKVANANGLSVLGVIEGSAVAHTHLLMHPNGDAAQHMETELATLPPVYHELYDLTLARAGARSLELMLPAVALALRYAQPHNAYPWLLNALAESKPAEALEHGRSLAAQLPAIAGAGPLLGTAVDLRRLDDSYRFYDAVLEKLEQAQGGIDSYDFLARPAAMHKIDCSPVGVVMTDGYAGSVDRTELVARLALMGAVLRTQGRRRAEKEFRAFQVGLARRMIGAPPLVD